MSKSQYSQTNPLQKTTTPSNPRTPTAKTTAPALPAPPLNAATHARFGPKFPLNSARPIVQAKMTVGPVGDAFENEADTVAHQVVQNIQRQKTEEEELQRQPVSASISSIQRSGAEDEEELQRQADSSLIQRSDEEEEELQRQGEGIGASGGAVDASLESTIQREKGSGESLSDSVRQPMEQAFGADFSKVRIHNNSTSDSLNRSIQAKAFTSGSDVFFRSGAYQPGSTSGKELLAHELTHTIQQGSAQIQAKPLTPRPAISRQAEGAEALQRKFFWPHIAHGGIKTKITSTTSRQDSDYLKMREIYRAYKKAKTPHEEYELLNNLIERAEEWMQNYGESNKKQTKYVEDVTDQYTDVNHIIENAKRELWDAQWLSGSADYIAEDAMPNVENEYTQTKTQDGKTVQNGKPTPSLDRVDMKSIKNFTAGGFNLMNAVQAGDDKWLTKNLKKGATRNEEKNQPAWLAQHQKTKYQLDVKGEPMLDKHNKLIESKNYKQFRDEKWLSEMSTQGPSEKQMQEIKKEVKQHNAMFQAALEKIPHWGGTTYRGLALTKDEIETKYGSGKPVDFETFASTSTKKETAENFVKENMEDDKIGLLLQLELKTGKDVQEYSQNPKENEITVPLGAKFAVTTFIRPEDSGLTYYSAVLKEI